MTPKEKAEELFNKFPEHTKIFHEERGWEDYPEASKQCAIICVDEIIKNNPTNPLKSSYHLIYSDMVDEAIEFWQEVKKEIEAL